MDGPRHCHIEWSKLNKYRILTHYVESRKMVQMNLFAKQKEGCRRKEQTYGYKGAGRVGMHWEIRIDIYTLLICSVQFSHSVVSDSLWPHGLQHARPPCLSPTPGAYSNSCPLSQWCHPSISSSVIPYSCFQSFPASRFFQMSQFLAPGGQRIGVSASASVLQVNIQDWFPLGWTGWISLMCNRLSSVFSNTTVQKHQFFSTQLSSWSNSHIQTWLLENP